MFVAHLPSITKSLQSYQSCVLPPCPRALFDFLAPRALLRRSGAALPHRAGTRAFPARAEAERPAERRPGQRGLLEASGFVVNGATGEG